ncbi:MAG: DUF2203 domain-containing protein [Planctomycetota bacterium]|jgi:hypothetical protein|nr:hypothetical protein [Planctomycetota bacterium]MDP6369888.1 DUF2203 domain-containing protein [Planctomycetota bacterium]MDP6839330.1 DUF2203 domain-containing protein [Planctomycetota bacterium]MDP6956201.1 DUF2203 domain-containing protein [Planctomycetota bacterium]
MPRRHFTPKQANRTLPLVRRIAADILAAGDELRSLGETPPAESVQALRQRIRDLMDELESIGCSWRDWDFETGLVDFPARIDGRPVLLCWRSDEETITWYHTPEGGYAARRPIPADLL